MRTLFFSIFLLCLSQTLSGGTIVEQIVARVGNEIITKSEYERQLKRLHDELSNRLQGEELEKQYNEQGKALLDFLINQKLLEQKAKTLEIDVEEDVNAAVKRLKEENQIPDDEALEAALRKEGSSIPQLREDFRKRIIQQRVLWNYVQGKVNISEDEIKDYFEKHKGELITEPVTKVKRYAISSSDEAKETLKAEADAVLQDLRNGKEPTQSTFPHLVIDQSAEFTRSELDPRFAEVIDRTSVNSFSDLVDIPNGFLILKVEDRKESQPIPFEEARGKIYNFLLQERAEKYQKSFLEDLRKQNYVVIHEPYS